MEGATEEECNAIARLLSAEGMKPGDRRVVEVFIENHGGQEKPAIAGAKKPAKDRSSTDSHVR